MSPLAIAIRARRLPYGRRMDLAELNQLIPVGIFAAGLLVARVGRRASAREAAALKVSELRRYAWPNGTDNDWIDMQVYLGQLRVALRTAGVPRRVEQRLRDSVITHHQAAEHIGGDVGWGINTTASHDLDAAESWVLDWLDRPWHVIRRGGAWRAAKTAIQPAASWSIHDEMCEAAAPVQLPKPSDPPATLEP